MTAARPFRDVTLGSREVVVERKGDSTYVTLKQLLGPYPGRMTDRLDHWSETAPDRTYIAKRVNGGDWRRITYGEARDTARRIAQSLVDRKSFVDQIFDSGKD